MRVCSRGSREYLIGARAHCATHTNMDMCTILSCAHQILSRAHQIFSREHQILSRAHKKRLLFSSFRPFSGTVKCFYLFIFYAILKYKNRSIHSSPHSTLSPCHSRSHTHTHTETSAHRLNANGARPGTLQLIG